MVMETEKVMAKVMLAVSVRLFALKSG